MQKLRVGIIGTGMAFERLHYPAYQQLADRYQIVALADPDVQKAREWAGRLQLGQDSVYASFRDMLSRNDIDVVDIMVPIPENYDVTAAVAERLNGQGRGIICEKPLASTIEEARSARDLAQKFNVPIMIAENYRYNEEIDTIRDLVRTRHVGDVVYFVWNRVVDFPEDMKKDKFPATEWRQYPDFPGGAFTDTGVHDIAGLRHIFGAIDKVHAFGRPLEAAYAPHSVIQTNLLFKSGVTGQYSFFCAGKEMQRPLIGLRVFGTSGTIYLEERDCGTINVAFNCGKTEQIPYSPQKGYYNELVNFHNALIGKEPISVPPELEFGDFNTVQQVLRSAHDGEVVMVDETAVYEPDFGKPRAGGRIIQ